MARPSDPLVLSAAETRKEEEFLASPRVPRRMERLIEEYIEKKTGKVWNDPVVLDRIREAVVAQKGQYWARGKKRKPKYGRGYDVLAYLSYHFPVYLVQFEILLHELVQDRLVPGHLRILDAGAGPGVVSLAVVDYYGRLDDAQAEISALDRSDENIEAYTALVPPYAEKKGLVTIAHPLIADLRDTPGLSGTYDLIVFSNVLNEIPDLDAAKKADLVASYAAFLSPEGTVVLIEPAEKEGSTALRQIQAALTSRGFSVYAPCTHLWGEACRPDRCWTFATGPDVKPPRLMEALAGGEEGYRFRNTDIKYSYAILRKDGLTRVSYRIGKQDKAARLGSLPTHVSRQIHLRAAKMSTDIGDEKRHVVKICDGTTQTPVYAVLPAYARNEGNEALISGKYGEILSIRNAGVRYNREADTYSIIIGRKTTVTPIGGRGGI